MKTPVLLLGLVFAFFGAAAARAQYDANWNWYSAPTYAEPCQMVTITANVSNTGTAAWNPPGQGNDFYVQLSDSAGSHIGYVQVDGVAPGQNVTVSFNATLPNIGGNGTATYHLQMMENGIQYFGPIQDVPIIIDYPPTTSLSASQTTATQGDNVTVTGMTSATYANVINQAIDYIPPSGGDWVSGTDAAGTRWDGSATSSDTISPVFSMSQIGTWQFRARGQDSVGQLSDFQNVNVSVESPITVDLSLDQTAINAGQATTARSTAGPAGQVVYHGLEGRLVGGTWQNWGIWNDTGGSQQSVQITPGAGSYEVRAYAAPSNGVSNHSSSIYLTVNATSAPAITSQPSSQTVYQNQSATFSASASGQPAPTYQWYRSGGSIISGATGSSYTITSAQPGDAGGYYVVASNGVGSPATSNTATLTVVSPPVITSPTSASGTAGSAFSYAITATNSPTSYGASGLPSGLSVNTSTGLISGTPTIAGSYNVTISATNSAGTGYATFTLTVAAAAPQDDTANQNQLKILIPN